MRDESVSDYCPPITPDKLDASCSLYQADKIDDLTLVTECRATRSWLDSKEKLETRLHLSAAEVSHKTVLLKLEEARVSMAHLTAYQAHTIGIESRLAAALQENDDLRQEQDSGAQMVKTAEAPIAALKDRTGRISCKLRLEPIGGISHSSRPLPLSLLAINHWSHPWTAHSSPPSEPTSLPFNESRLS
ncbi:hypothetical protein P692DRAFT_20912388 [Suillus brevipes Sb2]|nr:hypothetical protein P692DRAFT_20912388 [Suillus brevipes Sb2]